ncbi:MAG TPA: transposase, partial [Kofleriaceae bacterium]
MWSRQARSCRSSPRRSPTPCSGEPRARPPCSQHRSSRCTRPCFRVVQFSVQRTHIHLLVEANDRLALAKGMQAFGISAAKHINALIRDEAGKRRRGSVFPDRYHVKILKTPRQVRNCLTYVLNNWRHHGEDQGERCRAWHLDPFSSAVTFEGWKERESRDGQR